MAEPPEGTKTEDVLVSVVNQHANAGEEGLAISCTLPENPLRLVTVTMVCLSEPTGIVIDVALSLMVKSPCWIPVTVSDIVAVWDSVPLDPVTVM